jgi:protoporphyrinogen oxidase
MKLAIVGTGITGLATAQLLKDRYQVTLFERAAQPGGLIKCTREGDNLFHRVGGHVFNSRNQRVLDWFWGFFDRDTEFIKARRNAKILLNGKLIGYPLENYLYQLDKGTIDAVVSDLLAINAQGVARSPEEYPNFEEFLKGNFGTTLYELYFRPYNSKIWNTDLAQVPLGWLEGKLPMPNLKQMLLSNIVQQEEGDMVHATFYYAKSEGSQYIVNRMASGLDIRCSTAVEKLDQRAEGGWLLNGEAFDKVVFTGDVRRLHSMLNGSTSEPIKQAAAAVTDLPSNGTSNLFCACDNTDISWLYLPDASIQAHRIIYTGTFSDTNNRGERATSGRMTCVVEFSGKHDMAYMAEQVKRLPGNLTPIDSNYEPNSYVVQQPDTRGQIDAVREHMEPTGFYLAGRFAEWEYYNMDKAVEAAMAVSDRL